jgi:hypothetical protein
LLVFESAKETPEKSGAGGGWLREGKKQKRRSERDRRGANRNKNGKE